VRWIVLDVALALLSLGLLAGVSLSLWRRGKALGRTVALAGDRVAAAAAQLESVEDRSRSFPAPTPSGHARQALRPGCGVGSTRSS